MSLLQVEGLVKTYGDRTVVKGVDYHVEEGEIVGLLGPNGAGKTTTFRMTVGMIRPDEGQVLLDGEDITTLPMYKRARLGMGYLSQEPSIFRHMTVTENLLAVLEARGVGFRARKARAAELIEDLGLDHVAKSKATTLSGGERRRLELARTLALEPRLILLDEPFSGVDPIAVEDIQGHLHALRDEGIAVLITDHAVRETLGTTDRAYIIYEGAIFRHGDAQTLADDPEVREVYLGESFSMGTQTRPAGLREDVDVDVDVHADADVNVHADVNADADAHDDEHGHDGPASDATPEPEPRPEPEPHPEPTPEPTPPPPPAAAHDPDPDPDPEPWDTDEFEPVVPDEVAPDSALPGLNDDLDDDAPVDDEDDADDEPDDDAPPPEPKAARKVVRKKAAPKAASRKAAAAGTGSGTAKKAPRKKAVRKTAARKAAPKKAARRKSSGDDAGT